MQPQRRWRGIEHHCLIAKPIAYRVNDSALAIEQQWKPWLGPAIDITALVGVEDSSFSHDFGVVERCHCTSNDGFATLSMPSPITLISPDIALCVFLAAPSTLRFPLLSQRHDGLCAHFLFAQIADPAEVDVPHQPTVLE